jgi:hypothetical protein
MLSGLFYGPIALPPKEKGSWYPLDRTPDGTHCIGNSVESRTGPNYVIKRILLTLQGLERRPL